MSTASKLASSPCTDENQGSSNELLENEHGSILFTDADDGGDVARHARLRDWVSACESVGLPRDAALRIWAELQPIANRTAEAGAAMGADFDTVEQAASDAVADLIRAELAEVSRG